MTGCILTDIDVDCDLRLGCFEHLRYLEGAGFHTVDDSGGCLCLIGLGKVPPCWLLLNVQEVAARGYNSLNTQTPFY